MPSDLPNFNDLTRVPKVPSELVEGWMPYLERCVAQRRLKRFSITDTRVRTCALIALFGPAGDGEATAVFQAFVHLFLHHERATHWTGAVEKIPADREKILRVVRAVQACQLLLEPVERATFPLYTFIAVALKVPDAKAFIDLTKHAAGYERKICYTFQEKNFEYVAGRYRGLLGDAADPAYREGIRQQIRTISG